MENEENINTALWDNIRTKDRDLKNIVDDDIGFTDNEWLSDVFMVSKNDLAENVRDAYFWSSTNLKATDTSLGGNISINNLPQFTRTADIRVKGIRKDRNDVRIYSIDGNYGMGRYYGEKIDDNAIRAYLEFGVPEFNNVLSFLLSAVDYRSAVIANTGRSPLAYDIGNLAGKIAMFAAFPIISAVVWIVDKVKTFVMGPGNFDYYYLKPTMFKYWSIVNTLVIMMSTELGILIPQLQTSTNTIGSPVKFDETDMQYIKAYMPELITPENSIDVFAVVTKTQRAINKYLKGSYKELLNNSSLQNLRTLVDEAKKQSIDQPDANTDYWKNIAKSLHSTKAYTKEDKKKEQTDNKTTGTTPATDPNVKQVSANDDGTYKKEDVSFLSNAKEWLEGYKEVQKSTIYDGARFAIFNVEFLGSSTTSFSNSVGDLELEGILKGIGGKARAVKFNLGGGETIPGLSTMLGYAKDVAVGALDGMTFGLTGKLLTLLLGDANINLPMKWEDSSISLPNHSFKIKLIAPYGNPISQLINIYIPLASIMAGALPLAAGMNSYTSPFLCNLFVRGYQSVSLGMITSLSINKGTSNLPFNRAMKPLAIDIEFTVTDFSKVISMPVGHDLSSSSNVILDDNNPLNRYIQSLCGRDLYTTSYLTPKLKLRASRLAMDASIVTKPSYWGTRIGDVFRPILGVFADNKYVDYSQM